MAEIVEERKKRQMENDKRNEEKKLRKETEKRNPEEKKKREVGDDKMADKIY